jgi:hypothetical protein
MGWIVSHLKNRLSPAIMPLSDQIESKAAAAKHQAAV